MDSGKGDSTRDEQLLSTPTRKYGETDGAMNPDGFTTIWCWPMYAEDRAESTARELRRGGCIPESLHNRN